MRKREYLEDLREKFALAANRHLERHGFEAGLDHRSYKRQGIDRQPGRHLSRGEIKLDPLAIDRHNQLVRERNGERERHVPARGSEPSHPGVGAALRPRPEPEQKIEAIGQAHDQRPRTPERSPRLHEAAIREVAQSMSAEFANSIKKGREAQAEQKAAGRVLGDASYLRKQLQQQIEERRAEMGGIRSAAHDWGSGSKWRERHWSERSLEEMATGRHKWQRESVLTSAAKWLARDKELMKLEAQLKASSKGMGKLVERLEAAKDNVAKWASREEKALEFARPAAERELARRDAERDRDPPDRDRGPERERER